MSARRATSASVEAMPEAVGNWIAPVFSKSSTRDAYAYGRLAPLVLAHAYQPCHLLHILTRIAAGDDIGRAHVLLHIGLEDRIEDGIGRKTVLVRLIGFQFR